MSEPTPPPAPGYMHPDNVGQFVVYQDDGSEWMWMGDGWELVAPPGTHGDVVRRANVVVPLLDVALRSVKAGRPREEAIGELLAIAGTDVTAITEAQ